MIEKEKLIYAPFSGVGGIVYDKDAVYVELGGSHSHGTREEDESGNIVTNLIDTKETLDTKMKYSEMKLFTEGQTITADDVEEMDDYDAQVELYENKDKLKLGSELENELSQLRNKNYEEIEEEPGRIRRKVLFDDINEDLADSSEENTDDEDMKDIELDISHNLKKNKNYVHDKITSVLKDLESRKFQQNDQEGSEDSSEDVDGSESEEDENGIKWKDNLAEKAKKSFLARQCSNKNLMKLVYGK